MRVLDYVIQKLLYEGDTKKYKNVFLCFIWRLKKTYGILPQGP